MTATNTLTKEEELLLQDFSRNVSTKSSALFYGNAFIVSATPLWLFWRVHQMDPLSAWPIWTIVTIASSWLLAFAYRNQKFVLKHKIAQKRSEAVSREIMKKFGDDKKMSKKEKDERILWKKNEVALADYEATNFSIFYNNALYLLVVVAFSFFILASASQNVNYVADYEATNFSIFYNNALYLLVVVAFSFFILASASQNVNYVCSIGAAAGLVALFSTGTK